MKNKGILAAVMLGIFLLVFGGVFFGINATKNIGQDVRVVEEKDAASEVAKAVEKLKPKTKELVKSAVDLVGVDETEELPELKDDTITVKARTSLYVDIFATSEKVGKDKNGWLNEVAESFNREGFEVDGQKVSVQLRNVSSGLGYDYIRTGKVIPDGYSPSNDLYERMLKSAGISVEEVTDKLVRNYPGVAVSNSKYKELVEEYGSVSLQVINEATSKDQMITGYTSVFTSGTGLNFLVSDLATMDPANPLSDAAVEEFQKFQKNIPYVGITTDQLILAAEKGSFDGFVTEYQAFINKPDIASKYTFVPFGYLHDNPLLTTASCSKEKREILDMFAEYCAKEEWQAKAKQYGFNQDLQYVVETPEVTGDVITKAQQIWKDTKDNGQDIIAVFVCDLSGSMNGAKVNNMQKSLINSMQYINDNNYVGLVSYATNVEIDVPIGKFDLNQKAYFKGAIENWVATGGTATFDAIAVAANLLLEAKEEHPDAKLMMFLASDGEEQGSRLKFSFIKESMAALKIPIYTIGYDATIDALQEISNINEAATINADVDDVNYQLKNLFNSSL